jgi:hypothetical protein
VILSAGTAAWTQLQREPRNISEVKCCCCLVVVCAIIRTSEHCPNLSSIEAAAGSDTVAQCTEDLLPKLLDQQDVVAAY